MYFPYLQLFLIFSYIDNTMGSTNNVVNDYSYKDFIIPYYCSTVVINGLCMQLTKHLPKLVLGVSVFANEEHSSYSEQVIHALSLLGELGKASPALLAAALRSSFADLADDMLVSKPPENRATYIKFLQNHDKRSLVRAGDPYFGCCCQKYDKHFPVLSKVCLKDLRLFLLLSFAFVTN